MKKLNLLLLLISFSWGSFSQDIIKGIVKDAGGISLPGVSVVEKGTQHGTSTDFDGVYQLKVSPNATLVFSYLGFKTQEIKVTGTASLNITMQEDTEGLDEIVIIGYGQQKKESVLGAINQVKAADVIESGSANIANALNGVSAGLNVVQSSGQPGADDGTIFIRGNANPLILVDGVEIVGGFSNMDTRDVESISTLKDGAATAVYGIRGANGVIIITTKRGKTGKPKVSFSSQFSAKMIGNTPDMLNSYETKKALNVALLNDQIYDGYTSQEALEHYRTGDLPYLYPNTDWQDVLFKDYALSSNQTVSVRGGSDFVKYYASAGYLQEGDIVKTEKLYNYDPEFNFQRYSFRANLDFTLTKTTRLKTSVSSRLEDTNKPGTGNTVSFLQLYQAPPGGVVPVYPSDILETYPDPLFPDYTDNRFGAGINLYKGVNATGSTNTTKAVFSMDFELEQDLDFITKGLKFNAKYNYVSNYNTQSQVKFNTSLYPRIDDYTLDRDGIWGYNEGENFERPGDFIFGNESISYNQEISYYRGQFNYNRSFDKHNVTGLAIFSRSKRVIGTDYPYFNEDWVGRFTYDYDSRYFFEVSGAYNGDETFYKGQRFQFFPSFAVGVNLAKENFIKNNIPALNNFKVRYSYGQTGDKSGLGNNRWQYQSNYGSITNNQLRNRYYFGEDINTPLTIVAETKLGNTELTWATVTKQNVGVDFGLLKNKISGSVDFFRDDRDGLIGRPSSAVVPQYVGSTVALPFANLGSSKSHGYEVSLSYKNRTSGGFKYSVSGFYGFNENRVLVSVADGIGTPEYSRVGGKPAGTTSLLQTDGYFQNIDEVVNYPETAGSPGLGDYRYVDYNANGTVIGSDTEDQVKFDLPDSPKNSYSFKFNLGYKKWSMSALINGIYGHKGLVNSVIAYAIPGEDDTGRYDQLDYWTPSNTDAAYPALHFGADPNLTSGTTARIINLDYIKLRSVNLAYDFDVSNVKNISKLQVYLNGNNLLTISDMDYGDPEGNSAGNYPITARFNLGLNLSL